MANATLNVIYPSLNRGSKVEVEVPEMDTDTEADLRQPQIVVGIDGSDSSKNALQWAAKLAPSLGATIHAVVAWEYPIIFGLEGGAPLTWKPNETAQDILNKTLDEVFGRERPTGFKASISQGHATFVLLDASKDAQMLIVGSRGLGGFSGLLLGSVSSTCAEHAKCPVLVVHGPA